MSRNLVLLFLVGVLIAGCKKNQVVEDQSGASASLDAVANPVGPSVSKRELATGPMRELLLTLQRVHFGLDSSTLSKDAQDALSSAAEKLIAHPDVRLLVEGHTDERGTTEHNMALGERRANAVVKYLTDQGVPATQLQTISHGEEQPRAEGYSEKTLAENRRVDFQLMRGEIQLVLEEGTLLDDQGNPLGAEVAAETPEEAPTAAPAEAAPAEAETAEDESAKKKGKKGKKKKGKKGKKKKGAAE